MHFQPIDVACVCVWQARIAMEKLGPGRRIFVDLSKDPNVDWEKASCKILVWAPYFDRWTHYDLV